MSKYKRYLDPDMRVRFDSNEQWTDYVHWRKDRGPELEYYLSMQEMIVFYCKVYLKWDRRKMIRRSRLTKWFIDKAYRKMGLGKKTVPENTNPIE